MADPVRFCIDCKHFQAASAACRRAVSLVTGTETWVSADVMRRNQLDEPLIPCGKTGLFWEKKEPKVNLLREES